MRRILLLLTVAAIAWPALSQSRRKKGESPSESEGAQRLIKLNVAATDSKGEPVTDLSASEVQIKEDGKPENIAFFHFAGSKRPAPTPVGPELAGHPAPPATILLLDRWNEEMMTTAVAWAEVTQAVKSIESPSGVYIYMLTNKGDLYPVRPLPTTQAEVAAATQVSAQQLAGLLDDAVKKLSGFRSVDEIDPILRFNTTIRALNTLGAQLTEVAGRKSLIWVTHGVPLTVRLPGSDYKDFTPELRSFSEAAVLSEIEIYTVDQSASGAGAAPDLSRESLQMISSLTGGRWFASDAVGAAVISAMNDARGNYSVAYFAPMSEKDKKLHKIHVECSRKGVRLQTREAYPGNLPDPQTDSLQSAVFDSARRSPFDASEIGVRVSVTVDPAKKSAHLRIRVDTADVLFQTVDQHHQAHLSLMLAGYSGGILNGSSPPIEVNANLTDQQFEAAQKEGLVMSQEIGTSDKTREVRAIVFDRELHAVGSATVPVTTP